MTEKPRQPCSGIGPRKRLAFLVHHKELVNHFASVWKLLPQGSFDVLVHEIDPGEMHSVPELATAKIRAATDALSDAIPYDYLVSNHPIDFSRPPLIKRLARKNIRFMYAAGKSGWNLRKWNSWYEMIMCFGPHHAAAFASITDAQIVQMGYPRFDRYYNDTANLPELRKRFACDPAKKTVVWLPTWKELSSVGLFDSEISALTDSYNVVIKLHPLMPETEPERVEQLRKHRFNYLITDSTDNLPLYQLADFMLFDYGGAPLAALYTDKNMLLLDVPKADGDELMDPDSPDLHIRSRLGSLRHNDAEIAGFLSNGAYWETQAPIRRELRKTYFAPYFGFSSNIAANILMRLETVFGDTCTAGTPRMSAPW